MNVTTLRTALRRAAADHPGVLGVSVTDIDSGGRAERNATVVLPTASTAKLLVLAELARRLDAGDLHPATVIRISEEDLCSGTGLIQHLRARAWAIEDLAALVAAVSDNSATNRLLRLLGRDNVNAAAAQLGLPHLTVHDRIRDHRGPADARLFASSTARDLCALVTSAWQGSLWSADAASWVLEWMAGCTDDTLVRADLDADAMPAIRVWNKTGRDAGVRADAGVISGRRRVAYAAIATATPGQEGACVTTLRRIGRLLGRHAR